MLSGLGLSGSGVPQAPRSASQDGGVGQTDLCAKCSSELGMPGTVVAEALCCDLCSSAVLVTRGAWDGSSF